jgi:Ca2+-binding EF-hand superfamily protein
VYETRDAQQGGMRLGYATLRPPVMRSDDGESHSILPKDGLAAATVTKTQVNLGGLLYPVAAVAPTNARVDTTAAARAPAPAAKEDAAPAGAAANPAEVASAQHTPAPPAQPKPRRSRQPVARRLTARQQGAQAVMEHAAVCKTMDGVMSVLMKAGGDGTINSDTTRQPLYLFKKLDRDRSGALDHKELVDGLKRVAVDGGEHANDRHIELFVRAIDANNDGQIVFSEFMDGLLRFKADNARQMLRAASYRFGGQDWKHVFVEYDKDKNGDLNFEEFRHMMRTAAKCGKSVIDDDQLKQLFRLIDGDGTGTIDYEEFNDYLTNDMLALADGFVLQGESVLDNALKRIAAAIESSGMVQKLFFDKIDLDGDSELTVRELERAVCSLSDRGHGSRLTHEEAAAIVALCDPNGDVRSFPPGPYAICGPIPAPVAYRHHAR